MQPNNDNPLKKREEFAESLRKTKRQEHILAKRRKLTDSKKKALALAGETTYDEPKIDYNTISEPDLRQ